MFAAGNGGYVDDSCAFNGLVNSIYTIAITGVNNDGSLPRYGERCPGILAVTYSKEQFSFEDETTKLVSVFSLIQLYTLYYMKFSRHVNFAILRFAYFATP